MAFSNQFRTLITGGAGFVGSSLARTIKKRFPDSQVVVFDNLKRRGSEINLSEFKKLGITFVHGDIRNPSDFNDVTGNFDLFIEASAEPSVLAGVNHSADYLLQTNLVGSLHCLEWAKKRANCFFFLSTSRIYSIPALKSIPFIEGKTRFEIDSSLCPVGVSSRGISEAFSTAAPRSLYGTTKLGSELLIEEFSHSYGMKTIINRLGVMAGPGQFGKTDQGVFTLWVANHYFQKPLKYTGFGGTGKQVRDLLHPEDLFELIQIQIDQLPKTQNQIFNIGGGHKNSVSLQEFTQVCEKVTDRKITITPSPETNPVDIPYYVSDNQKAESLLGWTPRKTVNEIVTETRDWIKNNETTLGPIFLG
jgi:CDP-paratose 2-epimerase